MGRPTDFTSELADAICERLADGESLRSICSGDTLPHKATVFRWLAKNADFRDQYTRAREVQADSLVDDIIDIADADVTEAVEVQQARLRVDARKWLAGKLRPKVYGDKLELAGDPDRPLVTKLVREVVRPNAQHPDS